MSESPSEGSSCDRCGIEQEGLEGCLRCVGQFCSKCQVCFEKKKKKKKKMVGKKEEEKGKETKKRGKKRGEHSRIFSVWRA